MNVASFSGNTTTNGNSQEQTWAALCHIGGLAGLLVPPLNILLPLAGWMANRATMPLVDEQGKEALNFQLSLTLYVVLVALLQFVPFLPHFYPTLFVLAGFLVLDILLVTRAVLSVRNGLDHQYPLTIRFL